MAAASVEVFTEVLTVVMCMSVPISLAAETVSVAVEPVGI